MRLKTHVLLISIIALVGLTIVGSYGLLGIRNAMMAERRSQISLLLDFANSQLYHYYSLEKSGRLTREQAQSQAIDAINAQQQGENHRFFIRDLKTDRIILYPLSYLIGYDHDGGKMPDGRTVAQANRDAMAKSTDGKVFIELRTIKPNADKNKVYPKLNGLIKFEPWGWMPGIGFYLDDIDNYFWTLTKKYLIVVTGLFLLTGVLLFQMRQSILRLLGGEPREASEFMRKIANGDLNVIIPVSRSDDKSLMASLNIMRMKLVNLTAAIQENSTSLSEQAISLVETAENFKDTKSDEAMTKMLKATTRISRTVDVLLKSISRIRL